MLQRPAVYRVLRIAGVVLPAIVAYRWLELRGRTGENPPFDFGSGPGERRYQPARAVTIV